MLAWSLCSLCVVLAVASLILALLNGRTLGEILIGPGIGTFAILTVSFSVVGPLIASHRPENPIGWIFLALGFFYGLLFAGEEYAIYALLTNPGSLPLGAEFSWLVKWIWAPGLGLICVLTSIVLWPERGPALVQPGGYAGEIEEWRSGVLDWVQLKLALPMLLLAGLGAVISLLVRFRRAAGRERQQIKWFASAAALTFFWILVIEVFGELISIEGGVAEAIFAFTLASASLVIPSIPIATGIAILRYRLYDIDRIINRTLVYGSLTVMLALLYFGGVSAIQALFGALTGQEEQPQLAIVVSTLVIAALFMPLRRRIQSFIDRSFYRSKYDAAKTLEAFSAKLREETDLDALSDELTRVVSETMQPAHVSVWLHPDSALEDKKKRAAIRESGHHH